MAKLQPDYIKWVLTLNATQAQEEYHKLEKANRELQAQSRESRKAMTELEAQGKKGSREWINHRNSVRQATTAMSDNRKKMSEVSKQFDLNSMTVNQLSKRLKELKREFNNTSRATDPQRYREIQKAIDNTKQANYKATQDTAKLHKAFRALPSSRGCNQLSSRELLVQFLPPSSKKRLIFVANYKTLNW